MRIPAVALLLLIVLFGFMARAMTFQMPLLDHHAWRQADTASIARNFYRERLNPLYPQVDQRGAQPVGYVETGLELFAFTVAVVSTATGFYPHVGRLLNALLFIATALVLRRFIARRYGETLALVGVFVYAFGLPLSLYADRAFMNEPLLAFLTIACYASAQAHLGAGGWRALAVLATASTLIAMVKLPYLVVWAPVAGLFAERHGRRVFGRWELWLIAVLNVAAAALWYTHARELGRLTGLTFGMSDKLFDPGLVASVGFWLKILQRLVRDIVGPIGLALMVAGTLVAWKDRRLAEIGGLLGFVAYVVIVAQGNFVHDYYQLLLGPTACLLIALGVGAVVGRIGGEPLGPDMGRKAATTLVAVAAALAFTTFVRSASFHSWYELDAGQPELCRASRDLLAPTDRVVFVGYNSPQLLFCMDRRGWLLAPHESDAVTIARAWRDGATLLARPRSFRRADVDAWITGHAAPVYANQEWELLRLVTPSLAGQR